MTRPEALALVRAWTPNQNLIRHMLAVEAACRAYAAHFGDDPDLWGLAGLLHDADYERHPSEHPAVIIAELKRLQVDPTVIQAIRAHADRNPSADWSKLDLALFASDELTGLIVATALMRPARLDGLTASSVQKKMKDKRFAAGVHRQNIISGAEALGLPLEDHIEIVIRAMREIAPELSLTPQAP